MASLWRSIFVVILPSPVHQREPKSFHCRAQQSHNRAQNQRGRPRTRRWIVGISGFTAGSGGRGRLWLGREDERLDGRLADHDAGLPELSFCEGHRCVDPDLSSATGDTHGRGQGGAASQVQ